ncbi:biosynthetic-type acetolactate synthase large subunit [Fulvivirga imtechensis]|nr:biosynthetic-type acetolactate synthase large subunit [Fulvivirga imtechensis]
MQTLTKPVGLELEQAQMMTGAEAVIQSLLAEGVDTVFGYPGGAIMPVYDALYDYQHFLNHVLVRHEQGGIHAAQGYARVSGKVGVCFATSGPGATNLITGLADAMIDSNPLVCITGQVASHLLGTDAFQETDVVGVSMPVTKWNCQVTKAEDIPAAIAKAFFIARSGRPGPVLIDITKDAQFGKLAFHYEPCQLVRSYVPKVKLDLEQVQRAAELINNAKKPFLLVGQGVIISQAERELLQLVEKAGIPFAWTLMGLSAVPTDHELGMGMLGMHGNYAPNVKTNECDILIAVGMRFDDRVTGDVSKYAKQAKVIHIEIDPAEIDKNIKADVPVVADAKEALQALVEMVHPNDHSAWVNEFHEKRAIEVEKVITQDLFPQKEGLTMGEVIRRVSDHLNGDGILVTDVGQHQMVASRYFQFKKSRSNVTSGGLGTMGFALPAALGAKLGSPDREVVAVIGDGGFQMTLQELATIFQTQAAVKIIILNNNFLGMVRQWQQLFFEKRYSFTEMTNPDFIKISEAYGIPATKVTLREDLDKGVEALLSSDGPFLLEVVVEKEDNVFPMVPSGASVSDIRLE